MSVPQPFRALWVNGSRLGLACLGFLVWLIPLLFVLSVINLFSVAPQAADELDLIVTTITRNTRVSAY